MLRLWRLKWQRWRLERRFKSQSKRLKKSQRPSADIAELSADHYFTVRDIDDAINYSLGSELWDEARVLDIEIPPRDDKAMWASDDEDEFHWFTPKARAAVRKAIDEEKAMRFEVRTRLVTKIILPLAGVLVGVIGAITGLVAVLKK